MEEETNEQDARERSPLKGQTPPEESQTAGDIRTTRPLDAPETREEPPQDDQAQWLGFVSETSTPRATTPAPPQKEHEPTPSKDTPPPQEKVSQPTKHRVQLSPPGSFIGNAKVSPFPSPRLYHWTPSPKEEVQPFSHKIIVNQDVLRRVNEHVQQQTTIEIGGFLLGNRYYCPNNREYYIWIDNYSEAQFTSADEVSLCIDNKTWQQLHEELAGKYEGKKLLGWYHSHPGHTIFLSVMDLNVHELGFTEEWMVALVIDPINGQGGFFCRRGGSLHQHARTEFYEQKNLGSDESFMPWVDYVCLDGATNEVIDPPLSPLVKILHKPSDPVPVSPPAALLVPPFSLKSTPQTLPENEQQPEETKREGENEEKKENQEPPPPSPIWPLRRRAVTFTGLITLALVGVVLAPWVFSRREASNGNDVPANNVAGPLMSTTPGAAPTPTPPAAQTPAPAAGASTIKPTKASLINCKEDGLCRATIFFDAPLPPELIATAGDETLSLRKDTVKGIPAAIVNINETAAVKMMRKGKGRPSALTLPILFINGNDDRDRAAYTLTLKQKDIPPEPEPEEASDRNRQRGGRQRGGPGPGRPNQNRTIVIGPGRRQTVPCRGVNCDRQ